MDSDLLSCLFPIDSVPWVPHEDDAENGGEWQSQQHDSDRKCPDKITGQSHEHNSSMQSKGKRWGVFLLTTKGNVYAVLASHCWDKGFVNLHERKSILVRFTFSPDITQLLNISSSCISSWRLFSVYLSLWHSYRCIVCFPSNHAIDETYSSRTNFIAIINFRDKNRNPKDRRTTSRPD